jgi:hypothetical protein
VAGVTGLGGVAGAADAATAAGCGSGVAAAGTGCLLRPRLGGWQFYLLAMGIAVVLGGS